MWGRKELGVQGMRRGLLRKKLCARKQLETRPEGRARERDIHKLRVLTKSLREIKTKVHRCVVQLFSAC